MLLLKKYKIVKATNSRFVKDNKSCKSREISQLEKVEQEILTNNFDKINKISSSKNKSYIKKDFKILLLNSLSLQNLLISLSSSSSPAAANQIKLQNLTFTTTNLISRFAKIINKK